MPCSLKTPGASLSRCDICGRGPCREATTGGRWPASYMATDPARLNRLRELRLWHWRQALHCRAEAQAFAKLAKVSASPKACNSMVSNWHEKANLHIKFVQTLNDFFPAGDTAEADAAKEAGK